MPTGHLSDDLFRLALEAAPTGMLMVDRQGHIVLVNAQVESLFGYTREELIGQPMEILVPERFRQAHPADRAAFHRKPESRPMGAGRELYGRRKDGSELPVEIGLNPLTTPDGEFVLSSVVDITERRRAEQERERLLSELRVLLQEVHHRVKNNLQVISSMLSMQMRRLGPGVSKDALEECRNRVGAIALIHEKLYQTKDFAGVPFASYVRSLVQGIFAASDQGARVALDLQLQDVALAVDKAIPCGLILNELVSNALKHAFEPDRPGRITVALGPTEDGRLRLSVSDDGKGLAPEPERGAKGSLGLYLVDVLAEQLHGELQCINAKGTTFTLCFSPGL